MEVVSTTNRNGCNPFVYVKPPVPFRIMGFSHSEINYFIVPSVKFTADSDPASYVIACGNWPLIHTNQNYYGKPVEFFCRNL